MKALKSKPTYANVMATIAVFIALGGGAYAATQLPKNSVGAKQLKVGAVTQNKIDKSAQKALQGLRGEIGPKGETGTRGPAGATNVTARSSPATAVASGGITQEEASCGPGETAVGGGMQWVEASVKGMTLVESEPVTSGGHPTGWLATGANESGATEHFQVTVVCASP